MRHTLLGRTGLRVSSLALGTMTFGTRFGIGAEEPVSRRAFDLYVDRGGNFIDTANAYGPLESEEILGRFLQGQRNRFVLASKYSLPLDQTDLNSGYNGRKALVQSLEGSLRRLGTDHLDLYWVHLWDGLTPEEEVLRALDDAVRQGKVAYVGFSNWPAWLVARADALAEATRAVRPAAVQVEYNLAQRDLDREIMPMAERLGLGVLAWSPLAGGALTGKYLDNAGEGRITGPKAGHFAKYADERTAGIARTVADCAHGMGCTPGALAVAWLLARSPLVVPIVGARTPEQLKGTLDADGLSVPDEVMARLEQATALPLNYPYDFLRDVQPRQFKQVNAGLDPRRAHARLF